MTSSETLLAKIRWIKPLDIATTPILRIDASPDIAVESGIRPIGDAGHMAVLDHVVHISVEIPPVANDVLPKPTLPNADPRGTDGCRRCSNHEDWKVLGGADPVRSRLNRSSCRMSAHSAECHRIFTIPVDNLVDKQFLFVVDGRFFGHPGSVGQVFYSRYCLINQLDT